MQLIKIAAAAVLLLLSCMCGALANGYWLRAQAAHDTEVAERALGPKLAKIRPWAGAEV